MINWQISFLLGLVDLLSLLFLCWLSVGQRTIEITWSANISSLYPPRYSYMCALCIHGVIVRVSKWFYIIICSSPLKINLGDRLRIKCPPDATSNIWIQVYVHTTTHATCIYHILVSIQSCNIHACIHCRCGVYCKYCNHSFISYL